MNSIIEKGNLPFEIVTSEPSIKISGDKTRFPDIQIWLNRRAGHGFCLCELKPPEVKVAPDG
ncbi:MAG: hypothetical protein ISS13_02760 [Actinobacteria bacterium]|nr:hypothetical protein [Actinomycetota bacterium]